MNTTSLTPFNGSDYDHDRDAPRLTDQLERVYSVLSDRGWHTLEGIAQITGDPTPSISAQIRHLRKARFGGWEIEKCYHGDGLYAYRLTGERVQNDSEPPENCAPLPPAAPELLEMAHLKIGQIQGELETERAKTAVLTSALESILRVQPAGTSSGELFHEHFDDEGNHLGSEPIDPLYIIQSMAGLAADGLIAASQFGPPITPQISAEII